MTGSSLDIANRVVMGAAAVVVFAAGGGLQGAASPGKAIATILIDTTAGGVRWASVVVVTNGWWTHRRGRGWTRVGWVLTILYGVRCFHGNTALTGGSVQVSLHPDVTSLSPVSPP